MTGNPQLTERQETLLRQINNCRILAKTVRKSDCYDQNDSAHCMIAHAKILGIVSQVECGSATKADLETFGLAGNLWGIYFGTTGTITTHDGTPTGAAKWLEQHALELEAQV